jgi:hypothetical protein
MILRLFGLTESTSSIVPSGLERIIARKASAFQEVCQFLSCYLKMEHPAYSTRDVLAGIERPAAWTAVRTTTTEGDERCECACS